MRPWILAETNYGYVKEHPYEVAVLPLGATEPHNLHLPYGTDAKRSLIAKAVMLPGGPTRTSFLPIMIDRHLRPEILRAGDPRFSDMIQYMDWASTGFTHHFAVDGDEVAISA